MVFQGYGLFPHLSVAENVGFGLALQEDAAAGDRDAGGGGAAAGAARRVRRPHDRSCCPAASSSAWRSRARSSCGPRCCCWTSRWPRSISSCATRCRRSCAASMREIGGTFIFVTHDQTEAFALATRIVVMNEGRIEQVGAPQDIYLDPHSLFVADFVGETNVLSGTRTNGAVHLAAGARFQRARRRGRGARNRPAGGGSPRRRRSRGAGPHHRRRVPRQRAEDRRAPALGRDPVGPRPGCAAPCQLSCAMRPRVSAGRWRTSASWRARNDRAARRLVPGAGAGDRRHHARWRRWACCWSSASGAVRSFKLQPDFTFAAWARFFVELRRPDAVHRW